MIGIRKKIVFGVTSAIVVSLAMWFAFTATGQGNDVTVCVGSDSVLRSPESGICPNGTQRIELSGPDIKKPDDVDENDPLGPAKKEASELRQRLAELERRAGDLENSPVFEVVDRAGRVIFSVAPGRAQLYNENKKAVAEMRITTDGGGEFVGRTTDGNLSAFLGAYGERAGLRLAEGDQPRLDLLKQPAGNYSLRISHGDGDIAGIGESRAGTGALVVGDQGGKHKAAMEVNAGKGAVDIFNEGGNGVASLTESTNGGGLLVLTDANGNAMVLMKTNDNRYGVVMTFPTGFPYLPKSGLPGSYMLGCNPGPACTP